MMLRLTPEQISAGWDVARPLIVQSLPASLGVDSGAMANILKSLLEEESQLWVYYGTPERVEAGAPLGIVMTVIMHEPVSKVRYLLVYATTGIAPGTVEDYEKGLDTLRSFAEAKKCSQILAYVDNEARLRQLQAVGGVKVSNLVRL